MWKSYKVILSNKRDGADTYCEIEKREEEEEEEQKKKEEQK